MSQTAAIRVFLIDDQAMIRAALRSLLLQQPGFDVVGDSGDARQGIERVGQLRPDVVLLDITMSGLSGIDAIGPLRGAHPRVRILMVTNLEGETFVEQSIKAGADGYLSKDSDAGELALAVQAVHAGNTYLSPRVSTGVVQRLREGESSGAGARPAGGLNSLTPREREVFQLLALGLSNKVVARKLGMSLGTAKKHRENLQRKLEVSSAAEIARLAIREGLLRN
jgi:DNA-binding NarL/FixJ family response regulator